MKNNIGRSRKAAIKKQSRKAHRVVVRDAQVQFFYDHAGYSWKPSAETREQGRKRCAEMLAKAERYAADNSLIYEWQMGARVAVLLVVGCPAK